MRRLAVLVLLCRRVDGLLLTSSPAARLSAPIGGCPLVRPLEGPEFFEACSSAHVAIVLFHGEKCRSCRAFTPKYSRLAQQYQGQAEFFRVVATRNADLLASEHVATLLPWCAEAESNPVPGLGAGPATPLTSPVCVAASTSTSAAAASGGSRRATGRARSASFRRSSRGASIPSCSRRSWRRRGARRRRCWTRPRRRMPPRRSSRSFAPLECSRAGRPSTSKPAPAWPAGRPARPKRLSWPRWGRAWGSLRHALRLRAASRARQLAEG